MQNLEKTFKIKEELFKRDSENSWKLNSFVTERIIDVILNLHVNKEEFKNWGANDFVELVVSIVMDMKKDNIAISKHGIFFIRKYACPELGAIIADVFIRIHLPTLAKNDKDFKILLDVLKVGGFQCN